MSSSSTFPTARSTTTTARSTTATTRSTTATTSSTAASGGAKSRRSCAQFGWSSARPRQTWTQNSVCGATVNCANIISYSEAHSECESIGARLCSAEELGDDVTRGTGCNLDKRFVWTKSACAGGGIFAALGSTKLVAAAVCEDQSDGRAHGLRCCADVF